MSQVNAENMKKVGGYEYSDKAKYFGEWNKNGQRHGVGHLLLADSARYDGHFYNGLPSGLGVMSFPDGARYEGEFSKGWFHGFGIFWRSDGMKYEGQFRGGCIKGYGLVTFHDNTHGFPRSEGYFENCRMMKRVNCLDVIQKAEKVALLARSDRMVSIKDEGEETSKNEYGGLMCPNCVKNTCSENNMDKVTNADM